MKLLFGNVITIFIHVNATCTTSQRKDCSMFYKQFSKLTINSKAVYFFLLKFTLLCYSHFHDVPQKCPRIPRSPPSHIIHVTKPRDHTFAPFHPSISISHYASFISTILHNVYKLLYFQSVVYIPHSCPTFGYVPVRSSFIPSGTDEIDEERRAPPKNRRETGRSYGEAFQLVFRTRRIKSQWEGYLPRFHVLFAIFPLCPPPLFSSVARLFRRRALRRNNFASNSVSSFPRPAPHRGICEKGKQGSFRKEIALTYKASQSLFPSANLEDRGRPRRESS